MKPARESLGRVSFHAQRLTDPNPAVTRTEDASHFAPTSPRVSVRETLPGTAIRASLSFPVACSTHILKFLWHCTCPFSSGAAHETLGIRGKRCDGGAGEITTSTKIKPRRSGSLSPQV